MTLTLIISSMRAEGLMSRCVPLTMITIYRLWTAGKCMKSGAELWQRGAFSSEVHGHSIRTGLCFLLKALFFLCTLAI